MGIRRTFCYNCREKTTTIYGQDEMAKCWKCGSSKEQAVIDANKKENKKLIKNINRCIALFVFGILSIIIVLYIIKIYF